jgi:ADP-heptose:LPS heptosyltransferase
MRILVIRAGALGDTLMATPVLPALAERFPDAAIDAVASATAAPLLEGHPLLQRVFPLRWRNLPLPLSIEKRRLIGSLGGRRYDLAVVLEQAPRYYELVERARVPRIVGFRTTAFDPALHSIANNLRAAGVDDWENRPWTMRIELSPEELRRAAAARARVRAPLVGLHVGYGPAHRKHNQEQRLRGWSLENFGRVGRWLAERGATVALTGAREDRPAVERLKGLLPAGAVMDVAGRTSVREMAALIGAMDLLVSIDSGPAHVAAALGTPLVVLWGPGIYEQTRPVSTAGPVTVLREDVACAPCYGTPMMKACRRNICMERITPERVIEACREQLNGVNGVRPHFYVLRKSEAATGHGLRKT